MLSGTTELFGTFKSFLAHYGDWPHFLMNIPVVVVTCVLFLCISASLVDRMGKSWDAGFRWIALWCCFVVLVLPYRFWIEPLLLKWPLWGLAAYIAVVLLVCVFFPLLFLENRVEILKKMFGR